MWVCGGVGGGGLRFVGEWWGFEVCGLCVVFVWVGRGVGVGGGVVLRCGVCRVCVYRFRIVPMYD